eukprot:gene4796-biopygen3280
MAAASYRVAHCNIRCIVRTARYELRIKPFAPRVRSCFGTCGVPEAGCPLAYDPREPVVAALVRYPLCCWARIDVGVRRQGAAGARGAHRDDGCTEALRGVHPERRVWDVRGGVGEDTVRSARLMGPHQGQLRLREESREELTLVECLLGGNGAVCVFPDAVLGIHGDLGLAAEAKAAIPER